MAILSWDEIGNRLFTTGIDRGVLYPRTSAGVVWNGLVSIDEAPSGADSTDIYIDGQKFLASKSVESFGFTISAFTFPDEFQEGVPFNFCYRVRSGNDTDGTDHGYKLHIVYNAVAAPSQTAYSTISDSLTPSDFSWDVTTVPVAIPGQRASAHLIVDSLGAYSAALSDLETILYGTPFDDPRLPSMSEMLDFFNAHSILVIIDNGDGTWSASGPDDIVYMTDSETFEIDYFTAVYISAEEYTVHSF